MPVFLPSVSYSKVTLWFWPREGDRPYFAGIYAERAVVRAPGLPHGVSP
jgi:hypothetical protein